MALSFGYLLPTRERIMEGRPQTNSLLELAERAEAIGMDSVWVGDSLVAKPRHEPLTLLAAVAARTRKVSLGTAVLLPALRNPVVLAHQVATLDQISEGRIILGNGGPITIPPNESVVVGNDGTVSIRPLGGGANELANIDRIYLVNPEPNEIFKGNDGLYRTINGEAAEPDAFVRVTSGAIEASNVNAIEALVNMIEYGRSFESLVKLFKVAEEMDSKSATLMSVS
jgi:hypothetical protein